ncbi:hypothetical protein M3Y97_00963900 [Aphelenchoides bicaudatus]|nr:hypothetical protein M3Y97_00963900 [Aphelenchoides bicaudatus]
MSQQIRLRRVIDKEHSDQNKTSSYLCQRCKNHGVNVSKRKHDECQFSECTCERCALVQARACIEQEINRTCIRNPNWLVKEIEDKMNCESTRKAIMPTVPLQHLNAEAPSILNLPFQPMQYKTNADFTDIFQQLNSSAQLQNNSLKFTDVEQFTLLGRLAFCLPINNDVSTWQPNCVQSM